MARIENGNLIEDEASMARRQSVKAQLKAAGVSSKVRSRIYMRMMVQDSRRAKKAVLNFMMS